MSLYARTCPNCGLLSAETHYCDDYPDDNQLQLDTKKKVVVIRCHSCKAHTHGYASEAECVAMMATEMI